MKYCHFFTIILASALICGNGCQKSNPDPDGYETTCPFCNQSFHTEEECLNHQITCDCYVSDNRSDKPIYVTIPKLEGYAGPEETCLSKWMSDIPSGTRIADLTIQAAPR